MIADALPIPSIVAPTRDGSPLSAMRWERRVLVVFAGKSADPELARQRAITHDARAGFRARDLTVVEVVGDSVSGIRDYAPRLRAQYGVAPGAFAVVLLGKDGMVKSRASAPVTSEALFGQIDAMPMRRREAANPR